ncbi:MAG: heparan-alpha-glucosaminide N-acetyltransferase [Proteobacteria bacterium]|nr:heparan-alpha-glucosaminide N-acetyltransferase [Pseudomonadota bacterium]
MTATFSDATAPPRIAAIDVARGIAVYFMAAYHLAWDLTDFKLAAFHLFTDPFWLAARAVILSSFLLLAGLSMVMADNRKRGWPAFWRRLAAVSLGAALVSLGTYVMFPKLFVFFGVLHCIAVSSLLVLPFLRAPAWIALAAAIAILALPHFFTHAVFDHDWLQWIGLVTKQPESVDYVSILPWTGLILIGIAYGRWRGERPAGVLSDWIPSHPVSTFTAWIGRNSLVAYILHQPLLIGLVWLAAKIVL